MLFSHLEQLLLRLPMSGMTNTILPPLASSVVDCPQFEPSVIRLTSRVSLMKNNRFSISFTSSFVGHRSLRSFCSRLGTRESNHFNQPWMDKASVDEYEEQFLAEKLEVEEFPSSVNKFGGEDDKEILRRRRIGLANKGKIPWNKGRKHSAETREKIKKRTIEALSDPKVRKKMSECPRSLSNQTKARIRSSQIKLWGQRLKWKRSKEKFLQSWAESIATAAKIGGIKQKELDWDTYDKEIARQKLKWAAEKAKAKKLSRIQAKRKVKEKAEKMAKLAQRRKEQEEKAKIRDESKRNTNKKSKEEKEDLAVTRESKLKERLTKIHKRKTIVSQFSCQHQRTWEKIDVELIERQQAEKTVSLEDQIRAAKNGRKEHATLGALASKRFVRLSSESSPVTTYSSQL